MQTGKNTMRGLFDGSKIFNIPIYQRAYAWKESNLSDFLTDIINQRHDNSGSESRQYFLGTFLLHKKGQVGDFTQYDIIDGQQRLTTFSIFMLVLIQELEKRRSSCITKKTRQLYIKDDDVYKLVLLNEDCTFFTSHILEHSSNKPVVEYKSQQRLLDAKVFFEKRLSDLDTNMLEKIFGTATNAENLIYVVNQVSSATQIFELLNDRGKKLTDLESIKSFLMYNITSVSSNPDQIIKNIQNHFSKIYRIIENNKFSENEEESILKNNVIVFYKTLEVSGKEFVKSTVSDLINKGEKSEAKNFIESYPLKLEQTFELYAEITQNKKKIEILDKLKEIGRVAPFYPIMIDCLLHNRDHFEDLLHRLVNFTFRATLVGLRSNGEGHLNTNLKNGKNIIWCVEEMVKYNWWNINARVDGVLEYKNFYEWINKNILKYILVSYENHLRNKKGFNPLTIEDYFNDSDNRTKLSIEHISAQKAKNIEYDDDFNQNYLHNIGNLVIDSAASNSSKNNKNTNDKADDLEMAPLMSQNEIDTNIDWTNLIEVKEYISKREISLKNFIKDNLLN